VDLGLPFAKVDETLSLRGIDYRDIDAVCITHEHADHVSGLKSFMKRTECPVYISKGTYLELSDFKAEDRSKRIKFVKHHDSFNFDDMKVFVLEKPHDSKESISFVFDDGLKKAGVFTDLGHVNNEIKHMLKNLDLIFFEANYCEKYVKDSDEKLSSVYLNRIMSDVGHLGLHQTIDALVDCAHDLQKIVLSHVSENTNSYENVYSQIREALNNVSKFPEIFVGFQGEPTEWIE